MEGLTWSLTCMMEAGKASRNSVDIYIDEFRDAEPLLLHISKSTQILVREPSYISQCLSYSQSNVNDAQHQLDDAYWQGIE